MAVFPNVYANVGHFNHAVNNTPGQNGARASPVVSASSVELAKVLERLGDGNF